MWSNITQVVVSTTLFALVHSALASRSAKRLATRVAGERNRNGLYRIFFIAQSLVTFFLLAAYLYFLPTTELYRIEAPLTWLLYAVQAGAILFTIAAARQVGMSRIIGLTSLVAWFGRGPVPPEPEAQGPALNAFGLKRNAGPFAWSRHPLNFAPLIIFSLWPTMTTTLLTFNIVVTLYLVIGSLHEESRLRAEYGEAYFTYQRSGVSFYFPCPTRKASKSMEFLCNDGDFS